MNEIPEQKKGNGRGKHVGGNLSFAINAISLAIHTSYAHKRHYCQTETTMMVMILMIMVNSHWLREGFQKRKGEKVWSFAIPGGEGVSEGSEKAILLFWKSIFSMSM